MRTDLNWPVDETTADEQLKLDKVTVPVDVLLDGGDRLTGEIYLLPVVETECRKECVIDLVRSPEPFLPLGTKGELRMINKGHIVLLHVPNPSEAGLDDATELFHHEERVSLELAGVPESDRWIEVAVKWSAPADRSRLLDHLNDVGDWIAVEDESGLALIATHSIVTVRPLADRSP
ncbi:MAG: hypothetical protein OEQ13_09990 [Acidobacteriota bacterium]|nr:hypothetical protein [Acidobacteriota bacterium]